MAGEAGQHDAGQRLTRAAQSAAEAMTALGSALAELDTPELRMWGEWSVVDGCRSVCGDKSYLRASLGIPFEGGRTCRPQNHQ